MSNSLWPDELQHARLPCPSLSPVVCSNSCPLNQWCHLTSVVPFSSYLQSFPASVSFPVIWLFASSGQSIGGSASASVLLMNIQGWVPLGLTGWISLQSKGPSGVFSSTTVWKHLFFGAQPSSCCSWDSQGKNAEVVCHSLLHWITFCQHATPGLTLTTLLGGRFCSESCFPRWGNWS